MDDHNRRVTTRDDAIRAAGDLAAEHELAIAQMTPREQAEAAWTPTSPCDVDELEDPIRDQRGLPPTHRAGPRGGEAPEVRPTDGT